MKSVALIGPTGQLGTDLFKVFIQNDWKVHPLAHSQIQVENMISVRDAFQDIDFDYVVNTAAFHKVDECEKDPEKAILINGTAQQNVAICAMDKGAKAVFISTDYVFDGRLPIGKFYQETSRTSPINLYGASKIVGETATLAVDHRNLVVRISSVFGAAGSSGKGGNFVETILKKARDGESLAIVDDIQMSPTYTLDAAIVIEHALSNSFEGVLHGNNAGFTTWCGFARKILEFSEIEVEITGTKSSSDSSVKRPANSALKSIYSGRTDWEDGLYRYLLEKKHIQ